MLCAGITTYSPLRQWNCKAGDRVGVIGLGGLGHMAVKLAAAMGAEVTVLSTSKGKAQDAKRLGATGFEVTSEPKTFEKLKKHFNLIIDTVSAQHPIDAYFPLLKPYGAVALVGAPPQPLSVGAFALIGGNVRFAGSSIGGMRETQEMLDFCAKHRVGSDVEVISAAKINEAYERMLKNDVRYRFVIDAKTFAQ
ncbi:MAG: zinc-binding dehydrogenase [Archangiaceae bacterium]|nr:zinc-binding dehydrogenase [Archangiaceae bacterium]